LRAIQFACRLLTTAFDPILWFPFQKIGGLAAL